MLVSKTRVIRREKREKNKNASEPTPDARYFASQWNICFRICQYYQDMILFHVLLSLYYFKVLPLNVDSLSIITYVKIVLLNIPTLNNVR